MRLLALLGPLILDEFFLLLREWSDKRIWSIMICGVCLKTHASSKRAVLVVKRNATRKVKT